MIIHHEKRWLYLGIPKTASTTLHFFLPELGAVRVRGGQHNMRIPPGCADYLVFVTTRNPFQRAHALWRMLGSDARKGAPWTLGIPKECIDSFPAYTEGMLRDELTDAPLYHWSMSRWLAELPAAVNPQLVQSERLDAGLRRLGLIGRRTRVPVRNATPGDWLCAYDEGTAQRVQAWAAEDFRRFDYSRKLSDWRRSQRNQQLAQELRKFPRRVARRLRQSLS